MGVLGFAQRDIDYAADILALDSPRNARLPRQRDIYGRAQDIFLLHRFFLSLDF